MSKSIKEVVAEIEAMAEEFRNMPASQVSAVQELISLIKTGEACVCCCGKTPREYAHLQSIVSAIKGE